MGLIKRSSWAQLVQVGQSPTSLSFTLLSRLPLLLSLSPSLQSLFGSQPPAFGTRCTLILAAVWDNGPSFLPPSLSSCAARWVYKWWPKLFSSSSSPLLTEVIPWAAINDDRLPSPREARYETRSWSKVPRDEGQYLPDLELRELYGDDVHRLPFWSPHVSYIKAQWFFCPWESPTGKLPIWIFGAPCFILWYGAN